MGWLWGPKPANVKQFLDSRWTDCKILASAIVAMREYYAAVEVTRADGNKYVTCGVYLLQFSNGEMGRKDMDETCGPYVERCPEKILNLLTPVDEWADLISGNGAEYARSFRERCLAYHAKRRDRTLQAWMNRYPDHVVAAWQAGLKVRFSAWREGYLKPVPHLSAFFVMKTSNGNRGWRVDPYDKLTEAKMGKKWIPVVELEVANG